jgi:hypothetical protein
MFTVIDRAKASAIIGTRPARIRRRSGMLSDIYYKKKIEGIDSPGKIASRKSDRIIAGAGCLVPLFIACILAISFMGTLKIQAYSAATYEVFPNTGCVADINKNNNEILIQFSEPVMDFNSIWYDISYLDEKGKIQYDCERLDGQTFKFTFGRDIYSGEKIKITVERFFDSHGRYFDKDIVLDYR